MLGEFRRVEIQASAVSGLSNVFIEFEVINLGRLPTSLECSVVCGGFTPERKYLAGELNISEEDRMLPPHSTLVFHAAGRLDPGYVGWLFKTLHISPNSGTKYVFRSRINPRENIGFLQYDFELTLFRWFAAIPFFRSGARWW